MAAGDDVEVDIALDVAPREVAVPADLAVALAGNADAGAFFGALAHSHRKEWVRWIEEAKKTETRQARVIKAVESLSDGKRTR